MLGGVGGFMKEFCVFVFKTNQILIFRFFISNRKEIIKNKN